MILETDKKILGEKFRKYRKQKKNDITQKKIFKELENRSHNNTILFL